MAMVSLTAQNEPQEIVTVTESRIAQSPQWLPSRK
jgi:hypothetical protein